MFNLLYIFWVAAFVSLLALTFIAFFGSAVPEAYRLPAMGLVGCLWAMLLRWFFQKN